jgi:UDP-N-acetylglucosamine/UDP-N-acetylgalactosamine diphosphorylase
VLLLSGIKMKAVQFMLEKTKKLLKKHNQQHLLAFWEQLDQKQREFLLSQIQSLDFDVIDRWIEQYIKNPAPVQLPTGFAPASSYPAEPNNPDLKHKYQQAIKSGRQLISAGKVGAFVVAGGQGTRLGFDGPKGNFPITPIQDKTLFQFFAETITAASQKYNAVIPWYIMTSPHNYQQALDTFIRRDYFGLKAKDVFIFQQGTVPNFDFEGKILLSDKAAIACSPDGHGGSIKALHKSGAVEDMKRRGIEFLSYWQVDNPLIKIFDPLFIGLHALDKAEMSSKALIKNEPKERVGNFCLVDGKVTVIEYSDLTDQFAAKRNADGSLVFGLGSIAIHIINRSFIEKLNTGQFTLPFHKAIKKVPYIDSFGNLIKPDKPNGVKLEQFIFDALPLAEKSVILQTPRSEEFAPVKNAQGDESPEATRKMLVERWATWLESAGVSVPRNADKSVNCQIEIAPGFAMDKEDILQKKNLIPPIKPKDIIYLA